MTIVLFLGCIAFLTIGIPVAFAIGGGTLLAMMSDPRIPMIALPKYVFSGIDVFALMAVPFFILAAELMSGGALSDVLLRCATQFVGRFRGGMGHANILSLTFFSGISGSALADAAGPGSILIKMMRKDGYHPEYAAALTAAVAVVGPIIPPSISMIIYALAYPEVNPVALMLAGILPGIAIALAMAVINHVISVKRDYRGSTYRPTLQEYFTNTWKALPALALPGIILGGIAGGVFTPTEASVVSVFYALFAGMLIYRTLTWSQLPQILVRTALMTASVLLIVGMSAAFAWILTISRVPQDLSSWIVSMNLNPFMFLLVVNIFLLIFGIFIEPLPGIMVLVPILAPIAHALGINDLQFAIVVIVNLTMGMITPPVGGLLFVTTMVAKVPLTKMIKELWPFLYAQFAVLLMLSAIPWITTIVPSLFGYK